VAQGKKRHRNIQRAPGGGYISRRANQGTVSERFGKPSMESSSMGEDRLNVCRVGSCLRTRTQVEFDPKGWHQSTARRSEGVSGEGGGFPDHGCGKKHPSNPTVRRRGGPAKNLVGPYRAAVFLWGTGQYKLWEFALYLAGRKNEIPNDNLYTSKSAQRWR